VTRRTSPHRLHRSSVSVSSTLVYILCCILITCSVSTPHYLRFEPVHSPGAGLDGAPSSGLQDLHVLRLRSPAPPSMLPKPWYVSFIARLMKPATGDFHVSAFFRFLMSSVRNRIRHEAGNARFQSTGVTNPPLPSSRFSPRAQASHVVRCTVCTKIISGVRRKCMHPSCPEYNLCTDCEALPNVIHPDLHPLLKMKTADTGSYSGLSQSSGRDRFYFLIASRD
jgi:hypothetical protein